MTPLSSSLCSICFLSERPTFLKFSGVVLCIGGTAVVAANDSTEAGADTLKGNLLALFSALMYGW